LSTININETMNRWLSSFSEESSHSICSLYDEQASLWGTLSPTKRDNTDQIKYYFDQIFKYKNRYIELNNSNIRLYGDMAICNGIYTFKWINEGVKVTTVARFSFVYINKGDRWLIVEHHSSAIPEVSK